MGARWAGKAGLGAGRRRLGLKVSSKKGLDLQKRAPPVKKGLNRQKDCKRAEKRGSPATA